MDHQHHTQGWKKLGSGDLALIVWRRLHSVAIGVVLILIVLNIHKIPIDITGILEDINFYDYQDLLVTIGKALVVLYFVFEALILVGDVLGHYAIRYQLTPECVVKKGGVFRTYTHTIPGNRVQGVEVTAGPMQRLVKVSSVSITTAGVHSPNMTIHNLATSEAVAIQNQLGVDRD